MISRKIFAPKNTAWYIFFCWTIIFSRQVSAQRFSVLTYTVKDGLPSNAITAACEDSNGFLWLGTTNGVSRFNGKDFVNYGYTEGLSDLFIESIYEDSHHRLWIGTLSGISEFKGNKFVAYLAKNDARFNVWGFHEQHRGELWAYTSIGVYRLEDSLWVPFDMKARYGIDEYIPGTQIINMNSGNYINDGDKLVLKKNNHTVELGKSPQGKNYDYFQNLCEFNHRVFISTANQLYEAVGDHLILLIDSIPAVQGFTYFIDKKNNCWMFLRSKGLYRYSLSADNKSPLVYGLYNALGYPFTDKNNNLWVASYTGLIRVQPRVFNEIDIGQEIFYITATGDDQLLIFGAGGVRFYKNGHTRNVPLPPSYKGFNNYLQEVIEGSARDGKNNTWIITHSWKLFRWNGSDLQDFSALLPKQRQGYMYNMSVDPVSGGVFLCGDSTLITGNEHGFATYHDKEGTTFPKITSVLFTRSGIGIVNVYLKGIYFITKDKRIIKAPPGLDIIEKGNYTYFFEDRQGRVWVSNAGKGLISFNVNDDYSVKDIFQVTTANGLPDNKVAGMAFDKDQNAWIIATKEIAVLRQANKNLSALNVHKIDWKQGIVNEYTYGGTVTGDDTGNIWISGSDRVLQFSPGQLQLMKAIPKVIIEKIMLNMKETNWAAYKYSMNSYLQVPVNPSFDYSQNSIGIQFMGTCLTDASRMEYAWRLEPLDTGWSTASANNIVSILKLSPGKYKFLVKARAGNSAWSEPAFYEFDVRPPFWETWWFRLLIVLLASAVITGVFRYRVRQVRRQAAIKNKIQALEMKALKAQMNPHFIYNALNSIQSLIIHNQSGKAGNYISKFARLLRQILENADNNLIALDKELYSLQLYISLEELRLNFDLVYTEEIDPAIEIEKEKMPSLILQPFVENALWHGLGKKEGEKRITLKIKLSDNWITCDITDNGVGRSKATEQYNIFPEGHLSRASSITLQRLVNFNQDESVEPISFVDHTDEQGQATGTTVIIKIRRTNQINPLELIAE